MFSKVNVPWSSATKDAQNEASEGESLTTVLETPEQRSSLTLLVADCTEAMRQQILDTFDPRQTAKQVSEISEIQDDSAAIPDAKRTAVDQDKLAKELAQRQQEVDGAEMQSLKAASLKHFDDWRDAVIQRIGEVVNTRNAPEARPKPQRYEPPAEQAVSPIRYQEPPPYDENVGIAIQKLYPPINNPLISLPEDKRALILHSVLLLLLSLENYQAPSRILLLRLTTSLNLPLHLTAFDESKIARGLLTAAENMNADEETKKKAEENQSNRKWKVGLAGVAGAVLIGVTGGLAAPLLAAGIGSVMGGLGLGATAAAGYLGGLAGSTVLVGGLFGAYGGRMTSQMMDRYAREVEDFAFVPVRSQHRPRKIEKEFRRLRVAIGVSGWLTDQKEVYEPWRVFGTQIESFALRFELEALMGLGNSMTSMVKSVAWSYAKSEIIKRTVFASLMAGLWPLALLKVGRIIDNPFSIANTRATKAGAVLADALINKAQGERPVTLVGYSLGAKVIFACLKKLAERRAFGLVESVVLIGTPASSTSADWRAIRSVVSGRVVNVYSTKDYILAFLYRSQSIQLGVAGLQAIENVKGVENVDVSDIVSGHTSYRFLTGTILNKIGFEDVDAEELALEQAALKAQEAKDEKERAEAEQKEQAKTTHSTGTDHDVSDDAVKELEEEIQKKNEQSYVRDDLL